jgi:glutathione S-transferase
MARHVYHLVAKDLWEQVGAGPYRAASLATEGFIHCSYEEQVAKSANRFYAEHDHVLVLTIDPALLTSPLRDEAATSGERFPHIYGPIDLSAVMQVQSLQRDAGGRWSFPKQARP